MSYAFDDDPTLAGVAEALAHAEAITSAHERVAKAKEALIDVAMGPDRDYAFDDATFARYTAAIDAACRELDAARTSLASLPSPTSA